MALDETIIEFLSPINVAKNIYIDGRSLGANAFTSTTIPTNNNLYRVSLLYYQME
jgi:hypothetical protein